MNPLKVVIFEDEFLLANDLKRQIEQFQYEVIGIFRKAEDGLKFMDETQNQEELPNVVLMDISLAGKMSGIEAARVMVEKYNFALVFLTGMSHMEVFEEAFKTKPHAFLIKPFDVHQALVSIRLAVYQKSLETRLMKHQKELEEKSIERTSEHKISKDLAEEKIKHKYALLENLTSQIRDPMTGILSNLSILKEQFEHRPQFEQYANKIDNHIQCLLSVVDEIEGLKNGPEGS
jgi:DNA-binding NarL/FixJ family response regulator